MKRFSIAIAATVVFVAAATPMTASAEVTVFLKNGGRTTADECIAGNGKVVCYKMGGMFELGKGEVAKIAERGAQKEGMTAPKSGEIIPAGDEKKPSERQSEQKKTEDILYRGDHPEAERRIEEINARKLELKAERDKLLKERAQLQEDVKNAPDWMPGKQHEELTKRGAALDEKIKKFSDELNNLNSEEKSIIGGLKQKTKE